MTETNMGIKISTAPCCWGVDDVKNSHLPKWELVLDEAAQAGYKGIELGPYGYIPLDVELVSKALNRRGLSIIAARSSTTSLPARICPAC